jgi:two-component system copper resistance phosphate regulon response regulator CusR
MRLLLIEDDAEIVRSLSIALKTAGYAVDSASDGERGYFLAGTNPYDLIILDYNLPKLNGREVIKKIREEQLSTPILMITIRTELTDKVDLLTLGADDYLSKPFALSELLARVKAILRRPRARQAAIIKVGDLEMDPDKFLVTKGGKRISLSSKEFSLLEFLMTNQGLILSRQTIMEHVWDENADPFSNTIEVHIASLRKKLETAKHKLIFTFPNRGYKLDEKK